MDSQNFPKLKSIVQLFKESWNIYCLKIKTLLGIISLPVRFSFLFWILFYFLAETDLVPKYLPEVPKILLMENQ